MTISRSRLLRTFGASALVVATATFLPGAGLLLAQDTSAEAASSAIGDSARDLVFTPVTRCRVIDTRVAGGRLTAGIPRDFDVAGTLAGQGGASDCLVPFGASVVLITITVVQPQGPGKLTVWAFGGASQAGQSSSYLVGGRGSRGATTPEVLLPICNPALATCTRDITVQASGSDTDMVADVAGYFAGVTGLTVPWAAVTGKPPGFDDDTDNDTLYSAGTGLTQAGTVFNVDTTAIQARVSQTCAAGNSIRSINANGTVTCEADDNTTYLASTGLSLSGTTFSVNSSVVQSRVSGVCSAGSSIRAIDSAGAVTCETDTDTDTNTTYTAGSGLTLSGTTFAVNTNAIQDRVTGTCTSAIRTINADGTVECGPTIQSGRSAVVALCPAESTVTFDQAFSSIPSVVVTPDGLDGTTTPPNTFCVVDETFTTNFRFCCYGNRPRLVNWIASQLTQFGND